MAQQLGVLTTRTSSKLQSFPIPEPGPKEVLIKNVAVASNPKDHKVPVWLDGYASIEGSDVAGYVEEVGQGVTEFKVGDRVAAFTLMGTKDNKYGAYAQYTVAPVSTTFPIAESISFEEAATLPLAVMTAAIGLFVRLGFPEPPPPSESSTTPSPKEVVIINGASSSVGAYAVQLAKRAGLYVVGVAGESCPYAEALGADFVIDYRGYCGKGALEAALTDAILETGLPCSRALDCVSQGGTIRELAGAVSSASLTGGGKVSYFFQITEEERNSLPPKVTVERTSVGTAFGEDEAFAARFYRQISQYLVKSDKNAKPLLANKVRVVPGGLAGVERGLAMLKAGEVHAEKLVYRISETPVSA